MFKIKTLLLVFLAFVGVGLLNPIFAYAQTPSSLEDRVLLADHTVEHCEEVFGAGGNANYENCIANLPTDPVCDPEDPTCEEGTVEEQPETCEERASTEGVGFGWLLCGIINGLGNAIEGIFTWILGFDDTTGEAQYCNLEIDINTEPAAGDVSDTETLPSTCTSFDSTSLSKTWSAFRNLANAFFVLAFLYAIYQVAFSSGNNAYQIRSMLPRLAAAVVLVQLSFFLSGLLIDWSNELGRYVSSVFEWVFPNDDFSAGGIIAGPGDTSFTDFLSQALVTGAIFYALLTASGVIFMTIVTMLIVVFIVLVARKLLILMAVVLAPLAAIAWIHPQTDGLAKAWWHTFSKLLLMYPIIILLLKSGELMARATGDSDDAAFDLARLVAYFAPFFLIPFTFRFAGNMFGQIAGITNNASKGLIDRGKAVDERRSEDRKNKALAKYKANEVAGRKTGAYTRAKGGILGSSLLYGKKGGEIFRAEKAKDALSPDDRLEALREDATNKAVNLEAFKMRNKTKEEVRDEANKKDASEATVAAAYKILADQRGYAQDELRSVQENIAAKGTPAAVKLGQRLARENFSSINEGSPHLAAFNFETGIPAMGTIADKDRTQIGAVSDASIGDLVTEGNQSQIKKAVGTYIEADETNQRVNAKAAGHLYGYALKANEEAKAQGQKEVFSAQEIAGLNKVSGGNATTPEKYPSRVATSTQGAGSPSAGGATASQRIDSLPSATLDSSTIPATPARPAKPEPLTRTRVNTMTSGQVREYIDQQGGYNELPLSDLQLIAEGNPATQEVQQAVNTLQARGVPVVARPSDGPARAAASPKQKQQIAPRMDRVVAETLGTANTGSLSNANQIYNNLETQLGGAPTTAEIAHSKNQAPPAPTRYDYVHQQVSNELGRRPTTQEIEEKWSDYAGGYIDESSPPGGDGA